MRRRTFVAILAPAAVTLAVLAGCAAGNDGAVVPTGAADSASATPQNSQQPTDEVPSVRAPAASVDTPVYKATLDRVAEQRVAKPIRLTVGDVDIDMPVDAVGVLDNGDLDIPELAAVAGWWRFGAAPGEDDGVALIAAHVDDAAQGLGQFAALRDVGEGARVDVELDDGSTVTYEVSAVEQTSKQTVDFESILYGSLGHHLVLVTCGGEFNWDTRHYDDNVIVWAERADA